MIANKTKTMIVSRSRTMLPQSPLLTIGGNVLKESDDLAILGVIFDYKMTFEKLLRSGCRAASQRLGLLRKSWQGCHDRFLFGEMFLGLCPAGFRVLFCSVVLCCRFTPKTTGPCCQWCPFLNWGCV